MTDTTQIPRIISPDEFMALQKAVAEIQAGGKPVWQMKTVWILAVPFIVSAAKAKGIIFSPDMQDHLPDLLVYGSIVLTTAAGAVFRWLGERSAVKKAVQAVQTSLPKIEG